MLMQVAFLPPSLTGKSPCMTWIGFLLYGLDKYEEMLVF